MTREYLERVENFTEFCKTTPALACNLMELNQRCEKIEQFRESFSGAGSEIFTASIRTGIVLLLLTLREASVCEIQMALNEPRKPLISHHLSEMRKAGWLQSKKHGRWTCYSLIPKKRESMTHLLDVIREE